MKEKGLVVEYPRAPWYNDNVDKILQEEKDREKRINEGQFANLLPTLPSDRSKGVGKDKPRVEKKTIPNVVKWPI